MAYISQPNNKTEIASFDLPSIDTCPGKTSICAEHCYALKIEIRYKKAAAKYKRNYEFSNTEDFIPYMIKNIATNSIFRIHVSGDFYSPEYVRKWHKIANSRKDVHFYCYTRSWRIPSILRELRKLNKLPNVTINLSTDDETGKAPIKGWRIAYLSISDKINPGYLTRTDIVFRIRYGGSPGHHQWKRKKAITNGDDPNVVAPLVHRIGEAPVCPLERGAKLNLSCNDCRICICKKK